MDDFEIEQIECPCCHEKSPMKIWRLVDVVAEPDLKERLLNADLYHWRCDNCGYETYVPYKTIYLDKKYGFILCFSPWNDEEEKLGVAFQGIDNLNYVFRIVCGIQQLREKILIFEAGLNDIAIERMKFFMRLEGLDNIQPNDNLFYLNVDDDSEKIKLTGWERGAIKFVCIRDGDEGEILAYPMEKYYDYVLAVTEDPRMIAGRCVCVDEEWMSLKLKKM